MNNNTGWLCRARRCRDRNLEHHHRERLGDRSFGLRAWAFTGNTTPSAVTSRSITFRSPRTRPSRREPSWRLPRWPSRSRRSCPSTTRRARFPADSTEPGVRELRAAAQILFALHRPPSCDAMVIRPITRTAPKRRCRAAEHRPTPGADRVWRRRPDGHFQQHDRGSPQRGRVAVDFLKQTQTIGRVDEPRPGKRLPHLVALQVTDQVPANRRVRQRFRLPQSS